MFHGSENKFQPFRQGKSNNIKKKGEQKIKRKRKANHGKSARQSARFQIGVVPQKLARKYLPEKSCTKETMEGNGQPAGRRIKKQRSLIIN